MHKLRPAGALLALIVGSAQFSSDAAAAVTRLEIASQAPYGSFKSGDYARWDALIVGELSPAADENPPQSLLCSMAAGYVAFARTRKEREAANDSRSSLAERYKDRNDYANRVRAAARELERRGLLLGEDADIIVRAAAATTALK
jgi:hypothetical protein